MKNNKLLVALVATLCSAAMLFAVSCGSNPGSGESVSTSLPDSTSASESVSDSDTTGSESPAESDPEIEIDYEPRLWFEEGAVTEFTVAAGEEVDLPIATAEDDTDGDMSADVWIKADMNSKYATITEDETDDGKIAAKFVSYTAGVHTVTYSVENVWGNVAEKSVKVTVNGATKDGENEYADIDGLTNGGKYVEKLADFKGEFAKSISGAFQIKATEDSIEGNSVFADYSTLVGKENSLNLTSFTSYLKTGTWVVSFDMKLVSGTMNQSFIDNFYIGTNNSLGQSSDIHMTSFADLSALTAGNTIRIVADFSFLELPSNDGYYFHIFPNNLGENDIVIAYDNFEFDYVAFDVTTRRATFDDVTAENGITYDFVNEFTSVSAGKPVKKSDVQDETARAALLGSEGFSDTVYELLAGNDTHIISAFGADVLKRGYKYTLSFSYYKNDDAASYVILMGDVTNKTVDSGFMKRGGANDYTLTFEYAKNDEANYSSINLYGRFSAYIGNITLKAEVIPEDVSEFAVSEANVPSEEAILAGYTFTQSEGSYLAAGVYNEIAKMLDDEMKVALSDDDNFGDNVLHIKCANGNVQPLGGLTGLIKKDYKYEISFRLYVEEYHGGCVLMLNTSGNQNGGAKSLVLEQVSGKVYNATVRFDGADGDYTFSLYPQNGGWNFYIGKFTVKATAPAEGIVRDPSWSVLSAVGDKLTENFTDRKLGAPSDTANFEFVAEDGNEYLKCNMSASAFFFNLSGSDGAKSLLQEGREYTVTFKYKTSADASLYFGYQADGTGSSTFDSPASLSVSEEWQTASVRIIVAATENGAMKHFQIYSPSTATVFIDDLVIECTAIAQ